VTELVEVTFTVTNYPLMTQCCLFQLHFASSGSRRSSEAEVYRLSLQGLILTYVRGFNPIRIEKQSFSAFSV